MSNISDIIHLLPDSLANQIAAGEVVQRPASVVKELLENSIDAGSTEIKLIVKDAGRTLIQVVDNGKGMSELDARMCFERHATSKLNTSEDLFNIHTYGFRGEAMASIAAVSQVELKTRRAQDELGQCIKIAASEVKSQETDMAPVGTSISVKNLFFNIPARRNFLKSNAVELKHIIDEFQRVALANPHISMYFFQHDAETYSLPESNLSKRIVNLLGKAYQKNLITIEEKTDSLKIHGYIGAPEASKKTRGDQFFFANGRYIKHPYLHHALLNGYEGMLPDGMHPFYVIFLEMDPKCIDVNVHPTKTEVKFDDERTMYAILKSAIKRSLGTFNVMPSIDFDGDVNFGIDTTGKRDYGTEKAPFEIPKELQTTPRQRNNKENWERLYDGFEKNPVRDASSMDTLRFESIINETEEEQENTSEISKENKLSVGGDFGFLLHDKYLVTQVKSGMMMVNRQAALERILFEKYTKERQSGTVSSQQNLFPQTIELNPADFSLIMEIKTEIEAIGFVFNTFGKSALIVEGIPANLETGNEKALFEGLIEQFKMNRGSLQVGVQENLIRSLAKRAASIKNKQIAEMELRNLIDKLFACENPNFSPYGEKTFVILDFNQLNTLFK